MPSKERLCAHAISIFRHQFGAVASGLFQDATLARLAHPCGFAYSPDIFAMCAEAIQRAHRRIQARDGSWSGRGPRSHEIIVDGAIFVEAEVGYIDGDSRMVRGFASRPSWASYYKRWQNQTGRILEYARTCVGSRS